MNTVPRWSLDTIYTGFSSDSFHDNISLLYKTCEALESLASEAERIQEGSDDLRLWLRDVIDHTNMMMDLYENLESYAYTRFSVNTRDKEAIDGLQTVERIALAVKSARVAVTNAVAVHEKSIASMCETIEELKPFSFVLHELIQEQRHLMPPAMESLASDLQRSGGDAWGRLHESLSSTAKVVWNSETGEEKSVIELRALAFHPDRETRKRAFEEEISVWKSLEVPLAFALNGVKGFTVTLDKRRKYASSLERSIRQSRISRKTLDALIGVMESALPMFRRYLKKKAELLGLDTLAFYDLFAPVGETTKEWSFEEAKEFIITQFTSFYKPMGDFASYAFEHDWIDAQPAEGKVGGAYCIHFPLVRESRVLCNFDGSFSSVTTIAHELGHAFHDDVLKRSPGLLRSYPMTLAETASIFAETVIFNGALSRAGDSERLGMIESYIKDATQTIIDILSRFYFEQSVFARRADSELTAQEFCGLMEDAQKKTYGDALDADALHPYMWAVKGHYYDTDLAFYNYPYAFGQLFGLGLYAQYMKEGEQFCSRYVQLLEMTGRDSAVAVTAAAGFDIESRDFWQQGVDILKEYIDEFCALVDRRIHHS